MVQISETNVTAMWQSALDLRAMHESEGPPSQEDAAAQYEQALAIFEDLGDRRLAAVVTDNIAVVPVTQLQVKDGDRIRIEREAGSNQLLFEKVQETVAAAPG